MENQPGSGADIELCVTGTATAASGRSHSSALPLQASTGSAPGALVPPVAANAVTLTPTTSAAIATTATRRPRLGAERARARALARGR